MSTRTTCRWLLENRALTQCQLWVTTYIPCSWSSLSSKPVAEHLWSAFITLSLTPFSCLPLTHLRTFWIYQMHPDNPRKFSYFNVSLPPSFSPPMEPSRFQRLGCGHLWGATALKVMWCQSLGEYTYRNMKIYNSFIFYNYTIICKTIV